MSYEGSQEDRIPVPGVPAYSSYNQAKILGLTDWVIILLLLVVTLLVIALLPG